MEHCPQPSPKHAAVWIAFVLALVALVHSPALSGGFVWDDHQLIEDQRIVRELQPIGTYFANSFWSSPYEGARGFFRPLVTLSYALEWRLWDGNPLGFHATNLLLHLLNCLLVFVLARKSRAAMLPALCAMLLFGAFPRLTESVSWISGRTDLLAAFFALAAVILHRSFSQRTSARIGAAAAIFLGLCCKEVALAGAVAIGVFELRRLISPPSADAKNFVPLRIRLVDAAIRLGPLLAAGLVYALLRLRSGTVVSSPHALPFFPTRLAMSLSAVGHYALMLLWPFKAELQIGDIGIVEFPFAAGGAAVLLTLAAVIIRLGFRRIVSSDITDLLAMGACALVLVLHLAPLDMNVIAADRFLYVPAAGLAAAGASIISRMPPRLPQRLHTGALILLPCLALAFLCRTWISAQIWTDERGFWEKACLDASEFNASVWLGLAGILDTEGLSLPSLQANQGAADTALRLTPPNHNVAIAAWGNIAQGVQETAGSEAAILRLQAFIDFIGSNAELAYLKRARINLALVHARAGRFSKAADMLKLYAAENPDEPAPRALLANLNKAQALADTLPKASLKSLTPEQLKTRYAVAELLSDRLAVTDALLEMVNRPDADDATRNEAADILRAKGLCHRIQASGLKFLTNDSAIAQRCRPLPEKLQQRLPALPQELFLTTEHAPHSAVISPAEPTR